MRMQDAVEPQSPGANSDSEDSDLANLRFRMWSPVGIFVDGCCRYPGLEDDDTDCEVGTSCRLPGHA
jgi:hypothetical protein